MKRAFGPVEQVLSLVLIALAVWGIGSTLMRRAEAPPWMQPTRSAWV